MESSLGSLSGMEIEGVSIPANPPTQAPGALSHPGGRTTPKALVERLAFSYPNIVRNTPAATAEPMTPATLGPMAAMRGFTLPLVSLDTNC